MDDDEKGKEFLKLIDEQNTLQWNIVAKLSSLIKSEWNSPELKTEIENLVKDHYKICLLYTSPSPRDATLSRMPSSA